MTKNEILKKVLDYHKSGNNKLAIAVLKNALSEHPNERSIISLIGVFLVENNKFRESLQYLHKAIELKSQSEILYLSIYIAYVELEEYNKAFNMMDQFLEKNKANLFIDTLKELLQDLSNGYAQTFKKKIIYHATQNKIAIPPYVFYGKDE